MARVWQLRVVADGDTKAAQKEMRALQRSTQQFGRRMAGMGKTLTAAVTAPIIAMGAVGVNELRETMVVTAKTDAVFKSMGKSMKVTKGQLASLVSELESYSAIEGDIIQNAANVGLSFKALAANPNLFKATTRAAVDMSAALGMDLQSSMTMLGKAMQNGAKGAAALGKNGALAKDDIARLQKMAKDGLPMWKQQQFILAAINKQYAGQGKNVDPIRALQIAFKNIAETLATILLPAITFVSKHMQRLSVWVNDLSGANQRLIGAFLLVAAALGPMLWALGSLISLAAPLAAAYGVGLAGVVGSILAIPLALAALGVALVIAYRKSETFRNIVNNSFKSVRVAVMQVLTSLRATIAQWIAWGRVIWGKWGADIMAVVRPVLNVLRALVTNNLQNIRDAMLIILAALRGDWQTAWDKLKGIVKRALDTAKTVITNSVEAQKAAVELIAKAIKGLQGVFASAGKALGKAMVDAIIAYARNNAANLATELAGIFGGALGDAVDAAADGAGKSGPAGGKSNTAAKTKASKALTQARNQAAIEASAVRSHAQAQRQYNAGVDALAAARRSKDSKKIAAAQLRLAQLAAALVDAEQRKLEAARAANEAQREADKAAAEVAQEAADRKAAEDQTAADKAAQDARDAENFRRRALGMMSVEEEIELAAANEIRRQHGLPPVTSMSQIGSTPLGGAAEGSPGGGPMAAGDYGSGFTAVGVTSASAASAVRDSAMRALGGITINGASDPEAVARRVAFILGGTRLRMGGAA